MSTPARSPLVLVTGASGYLGGRLVPALLDAGLRVRAMDLAPARVRELDVATAWHSATPAGAPSSPLPEDPAWSGGIVRGDERSRHVDAAPETVWAVIEGIGGGRGWYSWRLGWLARGLMDRIVGGPGLRRGRRRAGGDRRSCRSHHRTSTPTRSRGDGMTRPPRPLARHLTVTASFLFAMAATAVGVGAFGGEPIAEAANGLLAADSTHLAPAAPAFMIWSVIYAGLGAYTLWQWWDRDDERRIAGHAIASLLLNAAWILSIQAGWVGLSVMVILMLLVVLADLFRRISARPLPGLIGKVVVNGTFGAYLGWVSVATCANIAAALKGAGVDGAGNPSLLAVAVLGVVAVIGLALPLAGRRAVAAPLAMIWGLAWIAVGRATDEPHAPVVALTAAAVAVVIAASTAIQQIRPASRARSVAQGATAAERSGR